MPCYSSTDNIERILDMFTTEDIKNAMNRIFELFPLEEVKELLGENCDVGEALDMDILGRKIRKRAADVEEFIYFSNREGQGTKAWKSLFGQKAAMIDMFSYEDRRVGGNIISSNHELWLLEDMTFAHAFCNRNQRFESEDVMSVTEYRMVIGIIRDRDDLFFDAASLFKSLDDLARDEDSLTAAIEE